MGRTAEGSEFESGRGKIFLHIVQTSSGAHPVSYPVGAGDKATGAWS
jgi:hypothetical protein